MGSVTRCRLSGLAGFAVAALAAGLVLRRGVELLEIARSRTWSERRLASIDDRESSDDTVGGRHARVVCVVPMYYEQDVACDTVRFWDQLALEAAVDEVVFVTTAKEDPRSSPSTHDLVQSELAALAHRDPGRLRLLHCTDVTRFRASQLNVAVKHVRSQHLVDDADEARMWVGVYNADSRPQASTFAELRHRLGAEPDTRVFQQLVDYVVPNRPGTGLIAVGNSVLQAWWTRSHYWARNTRGRRRRSMWAATAPYSTFGHGEFFRLDFLDEIGGFPDFAYADGLLIGWICRLGDEPIGLLASRDIAEVPRTAGDLLTQQTAWLRGLLNFDATVAWCRAQGRLRLSRLEVALLRAQHLTIPVAWGLSSAAVAAGMARATWRLGRGDATVVDLVTFGGLASYPLVPALVLGGEDHRQHRLTTRLGGVAVSWSIEGLAFWPALASHLRRVQRAPAKTPR